MSNLLAQKKEIKRLEKEAARRRKEEREEEVEKGEEEKGRAIVEFERVMMGLEGRDKKRAIDPVGTEGGHLEPKDKGVKRKFALDEDEMLNIARTERAKVRKLLDEEKVNEQEFFGESVID